MITNNELTLPGRSGPGPPSTAHPPAVFHNTQVVVGFARSRGYGANSSSRIRTDRLGYRRTRLGQPWTSAPTHPPVPVRLTLGADLITNNELTLPGRSGPGPPSTAHPPAVFHNTQVTTSTRQLTPFLGLALSQSLFSRRLDERRIKAPSERVALLP